MKRYIYDGSFEGLMTILYQSYYKGIPEWVCKENQATQGLIFEDEIVNTDFEIYEKVCAKIGQKGSKHILQQAYRAYLSGVEGVELSIINYLREALKRGHQIEHDLKNKHILKVNQAARRVAFESMRFKGFVRFKDIEGYLVSKIEPDYDILILIAEHFKERLPNEKWIIVDSKRKKALVGYKRNIKIVDGLDENYFKYDEQDNGVYENLWKMYFKEIAIENRKNEKCQQGYMPKKYWKNLVEMR